MKNRHFLPVIIAFLFSAPLYAFTIDSMESTNGFHSMGGGLSSVPGKVNYAMELAYSSLPPQNWVQVRTSFIYANVTNADHLRFFYKGSTKTNSIGFALIDSNSSTNTYWLRHKSVTSGWRCAKVPLGLFHQLDKTRISFVNFLIAQKTGDAGGSGSVNLDKVSFVSSPTNLIDSFSGFFPNTNDLGGLIGSWSLSGSNHTVVSNTSQGYGIIRYVCSNTNRSEMTACRFRLAPDQFTNFDASHYTGLSLNLKADTNIHCLGISLSSHYGVLSNTKYQTVRISSTNWTNISLTISGFSAVEQSKLYELRLWFSGTNRADGLSVTNNRSSRLLISSLAFIKSGITSETRHVDDMDLPTQLSIWSNVTPVSLNFSQDNNGYDGKSVNLAYTFSSVTQASFLRPMLLNIYEGSGLKFWFNSSTANMYDLIVHVVDDAGQIGSKKFYRYPDTANSWIETSVDMKDLSGTVNPDLRRIKTMAFMISNENSSSSMGDVIFDELRCELPTSYTRKYDKNSVISSISVDNMPFSPNNDGYHDSVNVSFSLYQDAKVSLRIYNLNGILIREFPEQDFKSGSETPFVWDGKDDHKNNLRNGLVLFQVIAKSTTGGLLERATQALAIVR
jgi:hypothetical protein